MMASFNQRVDATNLEQTRNEPEPEQSYQELRNELNQVCFEKWEIYYYGRPKSGITSLMNAFVGKPLTPQTELSEEVDGEGEADLYVLVLREEVDDEFQHEFRNMLRLNRKFLIVRTHIDEDIRRGANENKDKDEVIRRIRIDVLTKLWNTAFILLASAPDRLMDLRLFVVNSYDTGSYDFPKLRKTAIDMLPAPKREALIYYMNTTDDQILCMQYDALKNRIPKMSKMISLSPAPLEEARKYAEEMIKAEFFTYLLVFRLDTKSIENLEIDYSIERGRLEKFVQESLEGSVFSKIRKEPESNDEEATDSSRVTMLAPQLTNSGFGQMANLDIFGGGTRNICNNSCTAALAGVGSMMLSLVIGSCLCPKNISEILQKCLAEVFEVARDTEKERRRLEQEAIQREQRE